MKGTPWVALFFGWIGLALSGCGAAQVDIHQIPTSGNFPKTVAVLPFTHAEDLPEGKRPHFLLREVFFNHFSYLGYTDLPLEDVDQRLANAGLRTVSDYSKIENSKLREVLGADAVIRGHVLSANNFTGGIYSETRIKAKLEMVDLRTGEVHWETEHREWTTSGITTLTLVDIVTEQWDNYKVRQAYTRIAEEFVIKVLAKIPDPAHLRAVEVRPPWINAVVANVPAGVDLNSLRRIEVSLFGQPGQLATFDIGNRVIGIPMQEQTPGRYLGAYEVQPQDELGQDPIIACLKNGQGLTSKKVYKPVQTAWVMPAEPKTKKDAHGRIAAEMF